MRIGRKQKSGRRERRRDRKGKWERKRKDKGYRREKRLELRDASRGESKGN